MSENKINDKDKTETPAEEKVSAKKQSYKSTKKIIRFINIFEDVDRNQVVHSMPFILFITTLLLIYISNSYYAEGIVRDIDRTKKELKEKRAEYITSMSQLMYVSNQSEVAKLLADSGIKESTEPPFKLYKKSTGKK